MERSGDSTFVSFKKWKSFLSWALFCLIHNPLQVDLTAYEEKHEFFFDAVLDEDVTNDEVSLSDTLISLYCFVWLVYHIVNYCWLGILWKCGTHSSADLPTNKSNLLCVWANRQVLPKPSTYHLLEILHRICCDSCKLPFYFFLLELFIVDVII